MPTTFIFVHGAFGSPAELAPAAPHLESRGHRVVNVHLPSERPDATLDAYASRVGRAMEILLAGFGAVCAAFLLADFARAALGAPMERVGTALSAR